MEREKMVVEIVDAILSKRNNNNKRYRKPKMLLFRLPTSRVMTFVARSMILALVILSFPWLGSILRGLLNSLQVVLDANEAQAPSDNNWIGDIHHREYLHTIFHDLTNEGLLKTGDKAVFVSNNDNEEAAFYDSQVLNHEMELISSSTDSYTQDSAADNTLDFAFAYGFQNFAKNVIDQALKIGGLAAIQISDDLHLAFQKPSNYKIVYLRRFDDDDSTILIGMRKLSHISNSNNSPTHRRRLCGFSPSEAKKAALKNLEDVLLEPPRASSGKSRRYLKRTKFLPDLLGDSLQSYPRRVFIDVGLPERDGGSGTEWFNKNYPTRNLHFDMYKIETLTDELSGKATTQVGMSDWLRKNVKQEEYIVMKAEAEAVEEMMNSKAIRLVDELFLECKPKGLGGKGNKSRKAYWECLALYGKLRDEGVAVHQWWG